MHILYLEDDPNDADLVARYIRSTPHRLTIANTLRDAQAALAEQPDLILTDIIINSVPAGLDFVRYARAEGNAKPIIAVTGMTMPKDIQLCYDAGCNGIIKKPYVMTQLLDVIARYER